jgi:hypothetical protein
MPPRSGPALETRVEELQDSDLHLHLLRLRDPGPTCPEADRPACQLRSLARYRSTPPSSLLLLLLLLLLPFFYLASSRRAFLTLVSLLQTSCASGRAPDTALQLLGQFSLMTASHSSIPVAPSLIG